MIKFKWIRDLFEILFSRWLKRITEEAIKAAAVEAAGGIKQVR